MVSYRSATDEVERVLAIQKNYYAVLKVPFPSPTAHIFLVCHDSPALEEAAAWEAYGLQLMSYRWASDW